MQTPQRANLRANRAFVLIVEDESEQLDELALALELTGIPVMCANNGPAALELLARYGELRIVLLGWRMRGMSGEQVMIAIKNVLAPLRSIAIIALSGAWTARDTQIAKELGAVECIHKPYSMTTLQSAIDAAIERIGHATPPRHGTPIWRLAYFDFLDDEAISECDSASTLPQQQE